ncbi:unnamed protein product [Ceratitis capitata]|uniref:(Mediterranean fruit fly) hypothetical protein n=1 Tax=Ceratitis capitata TaxID=7213 RepID=A0A811V4H5_CERCA|nr:unnamed protein product [Ceratitis capitata]
MASFTPGNYSSMLILLILYLNCLSTAEANTNALRYDEPLSTTNATINRRIIGGDFVTIRGAPFIVNLRLDNEFMCGGSLLRPNCVLTAAHCVIGTPAYRFSVQGGTTILSKRGQLSAVRTVFIPPNYSKKTNNYDVAILRLARPMRGSRVQLVSLANDNLLPGQRLRVYGWGLRRERGESAEALRAATVRVIRRAKCNREYRQDGEGDLSRTMFCAAAEGLDSCAGDSGGPLMHRGRQYGIVSWGVGCARPRFPGVYTSIKAVRPWINQIVSLYCVFLTTDLSPGRQKLHSQIQIDTGELSMQSSNSALYYVFSLVETPIALLQKTSYVIDIQRPKTASTMTQLESGSANSAESSPENIRNFIPPTDIRPLTVSPPVQIEFLDESRLRKTREDTINIECALDFRFSARFYTLSKRPLTKVYRGENFLLRANIEVRSPVDIDILETYFICDHNLVQSTYSFKRKKFTQTYRSRDKLEDVITLRTNAASNDWITSKDFERTKSGDGIQSELFSRSRHARKLNAIKNMARDGVVGDAIDVAASAHMNKHLMGKIPNNMTIINNNAGSANSLLLAANSHSSMTASSSSFDEKFNSTQAGTVTDGDNVDTSLANTASVRALNPRVVFNKAIEAIQATGHCRGFFKRIVTTEPETQAITAHQQQQPNFGVYCIRWRRSGHKEENESKFLIHGLDIEEPPLNIYCTIEEKMFVKMPMTYKVVLRNPTSNVLHLVATLSISIADNFICSGHKQLDISIYAYSEKELVYNLYPLCVGWVNLPELTLEYNTKADPSKNDSHNTVLSELVQRSIPKKVFVLPPLKQQLK